MSQFATSMLVELARTTLWLALAGVSAALVLRLARMQSPALHRTFWCATLLIGCFLVRVPLEVPWYAAEPAVAPEILREVPPSEKPADSELLASPPTEWEATPPEFAAPIAAAPLTLPPAPPPVVESSEPLPSDWLPRLPQLAIGIWLAGFVGLIGAWLVGYTWFVWRLPRGAKAEADWQEQWRAMLAVQGIRRAIPLRVTDKLGPLLCRLPGGYELLVPEPLWRNLSASEREAILRHELAHYRRGDVWKSLGARVLALVHWFNPVSWWAVRRFDEAAEWACDRAASAGGPTAYAKTLMHIGELAGPRAHFGSALRGRALAARIRRLVAPEQKEDSKMKKALLTTAAACVVAVALVRVQLVAQEPVEKREKESPPPGEQNELLFPPGGQPAEPPPVDEPEEEPARPTANAGSQRNVVNAAKKGYEAALRAYHSSRTSLDTVYVWSRRWLAEALSTARNRKQRLAAARAHLERMQLLRAPIAQLAKENRHDGLELASANFFVADAEHKLAELESGPAMPFAPRGGDVIGVHPGPPVPAPPQTVPPPAAKRQAAPAVTIPNTVKPPVQPAPPARTFDPAPSPQPRVPQSAPPVLPAEPPKEPAPVPAPQPPDDPKNELRYDDKSFAEWDFILKNELSPERRVEALRAIGAFGASGWGREAAKSILGAMRRPSHSDLLLETAIAAFLKIPGDESLASVREALKSGTPSQRTLALMVLPGDLAEDEFVPLLVSTMAAKDALAADLARTRLAVLDHDNAALAEWLRAAFSGGDPRELASAAYLAGGPEMPARGGRSAIKAAPFPAHLPEIVNLLGHDNAQTRRAAASALRRLGQAALPALDQASSKSGSDTKSQRAAQVLDQILKKRSGGLLDWETE